MVARKAISEYYHVMRHIPATKRWVNEAGEREGPSPAGFALRPDDKGGLSVTEVEFFGTSSPAARREAASAYRNSLLSKKLGSQSIFAWAKVANIRQAAAVYNKQIRVVHDPVPGNPGHAEIRHFTDDDLDLLDHFAMEVFIKYEVVANMQIPPVE